MEIKKFEDHYQVKSESSNRWYDVFPDRPFCTCPSFLFYATKKGGICKHLREVQQKFQAKIEASGALDYVKKKGVVDSVELIDKFGEQAVNSLISRGELIEKNGKIMLL